jgi:phenylalanyl-tRNA synthetase beta chain
MSLQGDIDKKDSNALVVQVPVTRSDIMHECDLIEDLAISYGYNSLPTAVPQTYGGASEQPLNHLTDLLRISLANAGWTEAYNWALISKRENFDCMRREELSEELWRPTARPHEYCPNVPSVKLGNAKTKEFEIVRTTLLAGVLKCLASNKHLPIPIKIFEIGDIVVQEPTLEVGARNVRRICALNAGHTADFAKLHGLLDQIMYQLKCEPEHDHKANPKSKNRPWKLVPSEDPAFFPGRQASIVVEDTIVGIIGELHPEVMSSKGFDVNMACSAFEFNMEPFLEWL